MKMPKWQALSARCKSKHSDTGGLTRIKIALRYRLSPSRLQFRVLILIASAVILEGFDIQVIGFAAPAMIAEWRLTKQAMGPAMAAALFGMILGAPIGGRLGDLWGRRPLLIGSIAGFGLATLATSLASGASAVAVLRLFAGLGFGAGLSNATAMAAEAGSDRASYKTVSLVIIGVPCGGMLGAAIASWIIPGFGWRILLIVGGGLPCLLALLMACLLPESAWFLSQRKRVPAVPRPEEFVSRAAPVLADVRSDAATPREGVAVQSRWRQLVSTPYRRTTIGLALAFFSNLAISYAFFSWIPTLLVSMAFPSAIGIQAAFLFNLSGALGAAAGGWLLAPMGGRVALLLYVALGIVAMSLLSILIFGHPAATTGSNHLLPLLAGLSASGIATVGMQSALYGLAAVAYPTTFRATGIGVAGSVGRAGALVSAYYGGAILSLDSGPPIFLSLVGILFLLSGIGILIVDRVPPSRHLSS